MRLCHEKIARFSQNLQLAKITKIHGNLRGKFFRVKILSRVFRDHIVDV